MANKSYIHIDSELFEVMKLTPTEAVLYALVAGYCNHGQKFERNIDEISATINMSEAGVRRAINRLSVGGFITKERKQHGVELRLSDDWRSVQSTERVRYKVPRKSVQSTEQDRDNVPNTHYIINNNNNPNKEGISDFYELFLEIFLDHFKTTHEGREYTPNFQTLTTSIRNIIDNIFVCMKSDGYVQDHDTTAAYFGKWISEAWNRTDQWHRERWSAEFVNSQFTYFNNIVNTTSTQPQNGNQRQQNGISDDYIRAQFEKIARSRAARSGQRPDDPGAAERR